MAALFARLWLSRSVTDPVGLTAAKPFRTLPILSGWRSDCGRLRLSTYIPVLSCFTNPMICHQVGQAAVSKLFACRNRATTP